MQQLMEIIDRIKLVLLTLGMESAMCALYCKQNNNP